MTQTIRKYLLYGCMVAVGLMAAGCGAQSDQRLKEAYDAYDRHDYATALNKAEQSLQAATGPTADEAAYLAGRSAQELEQTAKAQQYFNRASRSSNPQLAGDSFASLGLILAQQERFDQAASVFLQAAQKLSGQDRAEAYFHAAAAQQKIGQWSQARANLALARKSSTDQSFLANVAQQLRTNGYTLQVGAFADAGNAQRAIQAFLRDRRVLQIGGPRLVDAADAQGRSLTLVQIGRFSTYAAARSARTKAGLDSAIIVPSVAASHTHQD